MRLKRLKAGDRELAKVLFSVMAEVFEEDSEELSDGYIDRLLGREDFWAIAAFVDNDIVGGLTAHTLPMTRAEYSEIFIYDIAVRSDHQRQGIGRRLIEELRTQAAGMGIRELFVPADNEDVHALDFYRALGGEAAPVTIFTFTDDFE
ncbi:GNAT family N-acetyltransferase [Archangium lansingense]|uniref:GNAT family N-acetyltransferase n=1 Tax=Archangium lansingense TaxID=2995310 RepID=A0ABT4A3Y7_9BACT|nr:GNAT family N-acetyltransferase [Archangium lansinium]MCY1076362.1 GNAT family N-acetyltransferase [Archangium lansinium]